MSSDDARSSGVVPPGRSRRVRAPSNWNIANALTMLRLLLVPVFGWC